MTAIAIDPLLSEVTKLQVEEFEQFKQTYRTRYGIGVPRPANVTLRERVAKLVKDIQQYDSYLEVDEDLDIIAQCVEWMGNDDCISNDKLLKFEQQILEKLHKRMSRYEVTSLHLNLMKEVMEASRSRKSSSADIGGSDDEFEVVETGLDQLIETFETESFTAKDVDVEALEAYLTDLMRANGTLDSLNDLRRAMRRFGDDILDGDDEDTGEDELEWCIMDLLKNDLLGDEKKKTLESYMQNPIAMKALVSLINMRSVRDWTWKNAEKGLPITARQDVEGQYHITIDEDLVDTLYLHGMATGWAMKLKDALSDFLRWSGVDRMLKLSLNDIKEREFFLEMMPYEPPEEQSPDSSVECPPPPPECLPPPPPPAPMDILHGVYVTPYRPKSKKKKSSKITRDPMVINMPPPPPPPPGMGVPMPPPPPPPFPMTLDTMDEERRRIYKRDFFMSRLPSRDGSIPKVTPVEQVQASLIKTLAAETKVRKALDNRYGCSVVDFHSLVSALPHKTVLVILKFIGVPEAVVDFFARFLAAKLNIGPSVRGTRDRVLTRACGVPERHGMELLFTEAVMFFAELAVSKKTGAYLYRLGSKCYFIGTEEQNDQAMRELTLFSEHTKLDFDDVVTQPEQLDIGYLRLAGDAISINNSKVVSYAYRLKKQLAMQTTVYDWVRVWNGTIGNNGAHLFGPLVDLFGKSHLEAVKAAYKQMFDIIFDGGSLTACVKRMLNRRSEFARTIPALALEAIIYLPRAFGGLGVVNPLIIFSLSRNISSDPNEAIQEYLDVETKYYEAAQANWSTLKPEHISKKLNAVFNNNDDEIAAALGQDCAFGNFMTKAALTRHREYALFPHLPLTLHRGPSDPPPPLYYYSTDRRVPYLVGLYHTLLEEPVDDVMASERVSNGVRHCGNMKRWYDLESYDRWVLQMYGDECFERFGSLNVWCEGYVPRICMALARGGGWDERSDDSSSDMTSIV